MAAKILARLGGRVRFSENELDELRRSIQTQGVLQPLLVRKDGNRYELIAGERRLRAARLAGLVPFASESELGAHVFGIVPALATQ